MSFFRLACLTLTVSAATLFALGCETEPKPGEVPVGFDVTASHSSIVAGESVTFTATTANTHGRDAEIRWESTGGEMTEVDDDRVRRVTFDEPGEYKVSADLLIEGKRVATDIVKVYVDNVE